MAKKIKIPSENDLKVLQAGLDKLKRIPVSGNNSGNNAGDSIDHQEHQAPETYIAVAPVGGIPALASDVPGEADCVIYQVLYDEFDDPILTEITGRTKKVLNLSSIVIPGGFWLPITRDKYGRWLALPGFRNVNVFRKGFLDGALSPGGSATMNVWSSSDGSGFAGTAVLTGNSVSSVTITNGGANYKYPPMITFSGGAGSGAAAVAVLTDGVVTSVNITAGGTGYTSAPAVNVNNGEVDTLINITVFDWFLSSGQSIAAGTAVGACWDDLDEQWYVVAAKCIAGTAPVLVVGTTGVNNSTSGALLRASGGVLQEAMLEDLLDDLGGFTGTIG